MTNDQQKRLARLAGAIALEAPIANNSQKRTTYVSWQLVDEIRAVLTESGIDWKTEAKKVRAQMDANRAEAVTKAMGARLFGTKK